MQTAISLRPQRGIALPIMLIMLTVMLVSSIYLLKSSNSSTLTAANLAYDLELAKAADAGLHAGFNYLRTAAPAALEQNVSGQGYLATFNPAWTVTSSAFWVGAITMPDGDILSGNQVQYVIHRMCNDTGPYGSTNCMMTSARPGAQAQSPFGSSLAIDGLSVAPPPQLHYVVTARINGARGGNVVTQAVVMKGP